eukprot:1476735-Rhodomonas_salina.1
MPSLGSTAPTPEKDIGSYDAKITHSLRGGAPQLEAGGVKQVANSIKKMIRREYEFDKADERVFNSTVVLMRHVSRGFAIHAMFNVLETLKFIKEVRNQIHLSSCDT